MKYGVALVLPPVLPMLVLEGGVRLAAAVVWLLGVRRMWRCIKHKASSGEEDVHGEVVVEGVEVGDVRLTPLSGRRPREDPVEPWARLVRGPSHLGPSRSRLRGSGAHKAPEHTMLWNTREALGI